MALKVFIDTEFTDFANLKLISIGFAAESGDEFYAELSFSVSDCSEFVREIVVPMLEKTPHAACSVEELYCKIVDRLKLVRYRDEDMDICFDYQTDWGFTSLLKTVSDFIDMSQTLITCLRLYLYGTQSHQHNNFYSTVTDLAKFLGLSTSVPRASAV